MVGLHFVKGPVLKGFKVLKLLLLRGYSRVRKGQKLWLVGNKRTGEDLSLGAHFQPRVGRRTPPLYSVYKWLHHSKHPPGNAEAELF